jgi:hypothetical protein
MAGLDPAIHASQAHAVPVDVDARLKAGHDENNNAESSEWVGTLRLGDDHFSGPDFCLLRFAVVGRPSPVHL